VKREALPRAGWICGNGRRVRRRENVQLDSRYLAEGNPAGTRRRCGHRRSATPMVGKTILSWGTRSRRGTFIRTTCARDLPCARGFCRAGRRLRNLARPETSARLGKDEHGREGGPGGGAWVMQRPEDLDHRATRPTHPYCGRTERMSHGQGPVLPGWWQMRTERGGVRPISEAAGGAEEIVRLVNDDQRHGRRRRRLGEAKDGTGRRLQPSALRAGRVVQNETPSRFEKSETASSTWPRRWRHRGDPLTTRPNGTAGDEGPL